MMDKSQAIRQLKEYSKLLAEIRMERTALARRESGLLKMIEGLREFYPDLEDESSDTDLDLSTVRQNGSEVPRGQDAIYRVLAEMNRWLTLSEITSELVHRGWAPPSENPEQAVRAALKRLIGRMGNSRVKVRVRRGSTANEYRLIPIYVRSPENSDAPNMKSGASELIPNQGGLMDPP